MLVDTLNMSFVEAEDENDQLFETAMNCAVRCFEKYNGRGWGSKRIQVVELLREAGGTAREIPREEWLAEQNEEMETTPEE